MLGQSTIQENQSKLGIPFTSSSASSTCSTSTGGAEETFDTLVSGFQWLKVTGSWGEDDTVTTAPLMDRSAHSHGSLSYFLGPRVSEYDSHKQNDMKNRKFPIQLSLSPQKNVNLHFDRTRSRSESPTPIMGRRSNRRSHRNYLDNGASAGTGGSSCNSYNNTTGGDYELKNAKDALVGSISAVINYLRSSGVSKPSVEQLERNLEMGRYFAVLKRVQDYIQCIESGTQDELLAKVHLAVNAWEALCRLKTLEYKRAYKHAYRLRYESDGNASQAEIKQAIELQIKIAEQSTSCHKKLYTVHKWQRRVLQRMKKASAMEPAGYEAVRCL